MEILTTALTSIVWLITVAILVYIYLSTVLAAYVLFFNIDIAKKPLFGIWFVNKGFVFIGAFVGLLLLLEGGFQNALFFIPENWGTFNSYYEEWDSTKEALATFLAFWTTVLISFYIGKETKDKT